MKEFKLSVEEYQKILKSIELEEISLHNLSVKKYEEYFGKEFELNIKSKVRHQIKENTIDFYYQFSISAKSPDKEKPAIKIAPVYVVRYTKSPEFIIEPEFYEIFPEASLKYIIWPYFREIVQNTISRMNLPPLVLPTII